MTKTFLSHSFFRSAMLCYLCFFFSCKDGGNKIGYLNYNDSSSSQTNHSKKVKAEKEFLVEGDSIDNNVYYLDTVIVRTSEAFIEQLKSNRLIKLVSKEYNFKNSLLIDRIKNLKIVGTGAVKLFVNDKNASVLKLQNCYNIHLDNLIIGHTESPGYIGELGALRISHSYNINISNSKLLGAGTFGLVTYDVSNLKFLNSAITACTLLIFDLEKSQNVEFINSKFHHNNLAVSVLGAFTNGTKEVSFLNCDFLDNKPAMAGNPAFNFMDNDGNFQEQILFKNCTFKNNKGFKWYGDKITLNHCQIDSSDFTGW